MPGDAEQSGETLHYTGTVKDKDTGKPIAGATVVVRRSILKATTRTASSRRPGTPPTPTGRTRSRSRPNRSPRRYLYIELDVEHPDYATRAGFGYALSMTRKNEKLGERPFFETIELRPAKPITGRVETPDGEPAAGCRVLAYSRTDKVGGGPVRVRLVRQGEDGRRRPVSAADHHARPGCVLGLAQGLTPRSCTWSPTASAATSGRSP